MFKRLFLIAVFANLSVHAQVGINTTTPDSSTSLHVTSKDISTAPKGTLLNPMTAAQRDNISSPANGLLIYNTDEKCYNYYNGTKAKWSSLCSNGNEGAVYTVDCTKLVKSASLVSGLTAGVTLSPDDYIDLTINVTQVGTLNITSNIDNGYYFAYNGVVTQTGNVTIRLQGQGTPILNSKTSTFSIADCQVTVSTLSLSTRTINILYLNPYSTTSGGAGGITNTAGLGVSNIASLLQNTSLFGNNGSANGIVSGFQNISITNQEIRTATGFNSAIASLTAASPVYDVVWLNWEFSYGYNDENITQQMVTALKQFLSTPKKAGLLSFTQDSEIYATITNKFLTGSISTNSGAQNSIATSSNANGSMSNINHPVLNGPFGDLRGKPYTSFDNGLYFTNPNVAGTVLARQNNTYVASNNIVQLSTFIAKDWENVVVTPSFNFANNNNENGGGNTGIFAGSNIFNCAVTNANNCKYSNMSSFSSQGDLTKINTAYMLNVFAFLIGKAL